jgi:hypothetical protein
MYGSQAAGLALPESDIDMMLLNSGVSNARYGVEQVQSLL